MATEDVPQGVDVKLGERNRDGMDIEENAGQAQHGGQAQQGGSSFSQKTGRNWNPEGISSFGEFFRQNQSNKRPRSDDALPSVEVDPLEVQATAPSDAIAELYKTLPGGKDFVNRSWWRRKKSAKALPKEDKKRKYYSGLDENNKPKENPYGPIDLALWKWAVEREAEYYKDKHGTVFTHNREFSPINDNMPGYQQLSAAYQSGLEGGQKFASPTPLVQPQPPQHQQTRDSTPPQASLLPHTQQPGQ
ncbi:hypothetical protein FBULB1_1442 [Fusarium bulbicola]|nr:hypothetical protein FBULB1_1442 [Fusarium bulbicola]